MDILKLRTFYQVAKLGSLTLASKYLEYGIPNISRQISSLEKDLDVTLFHRKGNKISLTLQGTTLFEKTAEILETIDSMRDVLHAGMEAPEGLLRIYATEAIASLWLPPYLKGFLDKYPGIRLMIHGDDEKVDFMLRESDVVIGPSISKGPDLIQEYLMISKGVLCASKEYLEEFGTPATLKDLDHHRLITRSEWGDLPYNLINWPLIIGREDKTARDPYIATSSLSTMGKLALDGKGIAALSDTIRCPDQGQLIQVLPGIEFPAIDIFYTYPRSMKDSKRVKCLLDYLLEQIAKEKT